MAVLGTNVSKSHVGKFRDRDVIGWFDNDAGGRKGWVSLRKACGPLGIEPVRIHSDRDPKTYSKAEIREFIEDTVK